MNGLEVGHEALRSWPRKGRASRRAFLGRGAAMFAFAATGLNRARAENADVRVTNIETHEISVPYADGSAYELNHYYGPTRRTIYIARTNTGLIGLGESHSREPEDVLKRYVGSSPFDWIGDEASLGLGIAMYDLMGKVAGVPVYKLFGQKYRSWVPAAAWTVSTAPRRMAEAVRRYAAAGYTWMKYHLSPFENVIDQMEAMQAVAPKGFRVHLDLTMGGTDDHIFELLEKISRYPIAGCFEDPLPEKDIEGYAELRRRCRLPILYHHSPLGAGPETLRRAADGYILGHSLIGDAARRAGLFAALELPFSLQNVGGNITRRHDPSHAGRLQDRAVALQQRHGNMESRCRQGCASPRSTGASEFPSNQAWGSLSIVLNSNG